MAKGEHSAQCSREQITRGNTKRCDSGTQEQLYKGKSVENANTSSLTTSACLRLRSRHRFRKVSVNLVPRVLSLPSSRKEERGPWERGWVSVFKYVLISPVFMA